MSDTWGDENLRPAARSPRRTGGAGNNDGGGGVRVKLSIEEIREQLKTKRVAAKGSYNAEASGGNSGPQIPTHAIAERGERMLARHDQTVAAVSTGIANSVTRPDASLGAALAGGFYDAMPDIGAPLTTLNVPLDPRVKGTPVVQASPATQSRTSGRRHKTQNDIPQTTAEILQTTDLNLIREKYVDLASLCEEVLTYCHLLDNSRNYTVTESLGLRETVRELEKLLDSARQREVEHLSHVDQHRETIAVFEKRYYSLKNRARTHIRECQEERDKLRKELDIARSRLKVAENELYAAQSQIHSQQTELALLRDQTKDLPSEKEITGMSLKLRRLEDENGRLATERNKLIAQLDDLQVGKATANKHVDGRASAKEISEHQATIQRLREENAEQEKELTQLRSENTDYNEYINILLATLEERDQQRK